MKNLKELEQKYLELGKEIEALKNQNSEKEEFKHPIYRKLIHSSLVVRITGLNSGELVVNDKYYDKYYKVGEHIKNWSNFNNNNVWQQLDVCEKTGFFDGQLVWCWDDDDTHSIILRFYEAKHKGTYQFDGTRGGTRFNNYEPFEGNYPDWVLEAFQTLER